MSLRDELQRTVCDCARCVACCRAKPGVLGVGDLNLILKQYAVKEIGLTPGRVTNEWILGHFEASEGAVAARKTRHGIDYLRIPTIVPRLTDTGCVFLRDNRCLVHDVAPMGCAFLDLHIPHDEGRRISTLIHRDILANPDVEQQVYRGTWLYLHQHGRNARPLRERQDHLDELLHMLDQEEANSGSSRP